MTATLVATGSNSPQPGEDGVLGQHHDVVRHHSVARPALLHVEPAEDVDDPNHHVEEHLLPLGHAEVGASVHHPEGHGAPVDHDKDAEVDVEEGGEEGEREDAGRDGEEAPEEVQQRPAVAHAALVVAGISQQFVVGGENPGERQEGAQGGDAYRERDRGGLQKVKNKRVGCFSSYFIFFP